MTPVFITSDNVVQVMRNSNILLTYLGVSIKGELGLRLSSFLGSCCMFSLVWGKPWADVNWPQATLQTGLFLRGAYVTWRCVVLALAGRTLTEKELVLYRYTREKGQLHQMAL